MKKRKFDYAEFVLELGNNGSNVPNYLDKKLTKSEISYITHKTIKECWKKQ